MQIQRTEFQNNYKFFFRKITTRLRLVFAAQIRVHTISPSSVRAQVLLTFTPIDKTYIFVLNNITIDQSSAFTNDILRAPYCSDSSSSCLPVSAFITNRKFNSNYFLPSDISYGNRSTGVVGGFRVRRLVSFSAIIKN